MIEIAGRKIGIIADAGSDLAGIGKVRKADRKPESPDAFPLSNGLVRIPSETRIGPVGGGYFLHSFTATVAVFA